VQLILLSPPSTSIKLREVLNHRLSLSLWTPSGDPFFYHCTIWIKTRKYWYCGSLIGSGSLENLAIGHIIQTSPLLFNIGYHWEMHFNFPIEASLNMWCHEAYLHFTFTTITFIHLIQMLDRKIKLTSCRMHNFLIGLENFALWSFREILVR